MVGVVSCARSDFQIPGRGFRVAGGVTVTDPPRSCQVTGLPERRSLVSGAFLIETSRAASVLFGSRGLQRQDAPAALRSAASFSAEEPDDTGTMTSGSRPSISFRPLRVNRAQFGIRTSNPIRANRAGAPPSTYPHPAPVVCSPSTRATPLSRRRTMKSSDAEAVPPSARIRTGPVHAPWPSTDSTPGGPKLPHTAWLRQIGSRSHGGSRIDTIVRTRVRSVNRLAVSTVHSVPPPFPVRSTSTVRTPREMKDSSTSVSSVWSAALTRSCVALESAATPTCSQTLRYPSSPKCTIRRTPRDPMRPEGKGASESGCHSSDFSKGKSKS